jgi:hypothetical protein
MTAFRLLRRLLPSQNIDALLGDIAEESRRRSRRWYWAQLAAVVMLASMRDVRRHPTLALRAIGVGLLTLVIAFAPASALLHVVRVLSEGGYYVGPYWLTLPPNAFRWFPGVVNTLGFAASGWTIARFHRAQGISLVLPWALLISVVLAAFFITAVAVDTYPTVWTAPKIGGLVITISLPAWVVAGGVLGVGRGPTGHRSWKRT